MHARMLTAVLAAAVLASAAPLGARASEPGHDYAPDRGPDLQQVQHDWRRAARALMRYGVAQRNEALERGKRLLHRMDRRLDTLEAQTQKDWSHLDRSAREQRRKTLRELRRQRNRVAQWYGGMEHGSAGAWNNVKRGFVTAYGALDRSFIRAARSFERG